MDRVDEIRTVHELLARPDTGLVTLTGPGGTGKTRIALQVAAELPTLFPDGVVWVSLATVRDPQLVPSAIGRSLGLSDTGDISSMEPIVRSISTKRLLLLVDNFEQVGDAASLVADLLGSCPNLKVLATTRAPLRVRGEREVPVPPLDVPEADGVRAAADLARYAAAELFLQRARAVKPDLEVTDDLAPTVGSICALLDGLPLAIELAAARVKALPLPTLRARLGHRLPLLTGGARDLPARQQTLRAAIAWSHDLLEERQRVLFRRLAVFAGGISLDAARAVCAVTPEACPDDVELLDTLTALVDQSLLRQSALSADPRFSMLRTIREFAEEQLESSGEGDAVRREHASFFAAMARDAEPAIVSAARPDALARLDGELGNIRAALAWAQAHDPPMLRRLAGSLTWYWNFRGYFTEGRGWLEAALAPEHAAEPTTARARVLFGAGLLAWLQFDSPSAARRLGESVAAWEALGEKRGLAYALVYLGMALARTDGPAAEAHIRRGVATFRDGADRWGLALALRCLGWLATLRGDREASRAAQEEGLAIYRELGDSWGIASGLRTLGERSRAEGDYRAALAQLEESLARYRAMGDRWGVVRAARPLANLLHERGDYAAATALLEESLAISRELGARWSVAWALNGLGLQARDEGDHPRARAMLEESLALSRETGDRSEVAWSLDRLGTVLHALGDLEAAQARYAESLRLAAELGDRLLAAWTSHNLGCLALDRGDLDGARAYLARGARTFRERGETLASIHSLAAFACLASARGHPDTALRLAAAAEAQCRSLGIALVPAERARLDRAAAASRESLGPAAALACDEGRTLALDGALDLALQTLT